MAPRLSVIIPCFNDGHHLTEALASVEAQTLPDLEVLVVDDGSSDPTTCQILEAGSQAGWRVLRRPHAGVCAARNHGLAAATSDYVCFLDADDRLLPPCLERACARLDSDSSLTFVSFGVRIFGDEEWVWQKESCDALALLQECCVATSAVARRAALLEIGGFDVACELGHEDWDLWLSLIERGGRGVVLPEVLFEYRRRRGSRSGLADDHGVYLELLRERFAKHEAQYRAHLLELLTAQDAVARHHLAEASMPIGELEEQVSRRRDEVARRRREVRR